jgi:hypothetical protein
MTHLQKAQALGVAAAERDFEKDATSKNVFKQMMSLRERGSASPMIRERLGAKLEGRKAVDRSDVGKQLKEDYEQTRRLGERQRGDKADPLAHRGKKGFRVTDKEYDVYLHNYDKFGTKQDMTSGARELNKVAYSQGAEKAVRRFIKLAVLQPKKIKRDAFIYLDPKGNKKKFAQCETCMMWTGPKHLTCTIHGKDATAKATMSCDFYVHGMPMPQMAGKEHKSVTPKESGLVDRPVRCENCAHYDTKPSKCEMFAALNKSHPAMFDLEEGVDKYGCCNGNVPMEEAA